MKKKAKRRTTDEENESHEEIDDTHDDTVGFPANVKDQIFIYLAI